jgi:hypothetical protein
MAMRRARATTTGGRGRASGGTREVRVSGIETARLDGACRVVRADVDGAELWFESDDAELAPAPEAFGSALLLPALHLGARLHLDATVDRTWLHNTAKIASTLHRWWRYAERPPRVADTEDAPARPATGSVAAAPNARTALCFSGGVDSFHALLKGEENPGVLVSVWGFDIPLDDATRWAAFERSAREVADAVGARLITVRTNLRDLALVNGPAWERAHGGALAGLAHLLQGDVDRLLVSSSIPYHWKRPWGSHWELDPHWSSSRARVVHVGARLRRTDKLPEIADEPLVQEHLRVCWENRVPVGNCLYCEKCLRTELRLAMAGALGSFPGFRCGTPLAERLDAIPVGVGRGRTYRAALRSGSMPPDVEGALRRLLRRTRRARLLARASFGRLGRRLVP